MIVGIRGATSIENNTKEEIISRTIELYTQIIEKNNIKRIISIFCSVTPDITAYNPITAIRENFKLDNVALFTLQEAVFENSPKAIIRLLIHCEGDTQNFVYLHKAKDLRKDIIK
ncbi:monofunctional chorismate mutase, clade 1 [Marinitoga piezophila KA3]|uniref:chorismate mutase n=1 Tax=Marinitoga piezophila (strain DSM 14283 / JCM 11233 / KA3) TaxID=443254 RepID=H2J7F9_MARPK|nr:chorismate mutase [Marinitoga piezophila]AEX86452.1 monofunctional chorismate mutase, clade 1 [Marinitoga piezophila KA3]